MKTYSAVILTYVTILFSQSAIAQSTITIGAINSKQLVPFNGYTGEYQQVYASTGFPNPVQITQIAFSSLSVSNSVANYDLSVGLGLTAKAPTSLGTDFETGFLTVFSGSLSPAFTSTTGDFDLVINFTSPFNYDPSQGNLLLDIVVSSANNGTLFLAQGISASNMGALWMNGSSSVSGGGLITQFTVVPEPSAFSLIFLGSGVLLYVRPIKKHSHI